MIMDWEIWTVVMLGGIVAEAMTPALVSIWFSIGSAAALFSSLFTDSFVIQLIVFCITTTLSFLLFYHPLMKWIRQKRKEPDISDDIIGKEGVTVTMIKEPFGGRVRVGDTEWQAVSASGEEIRKGKRVMIVSRSSITLIVIPVTQSKGGDQS